jgi:hypothetical protein
VKSKSSNVVSGQSSPTKLLELWRVDDPLTGNNALWLQGDHTKSSPRKFAGDFAIHGIGQKM